MDQKNKNLPVNESLGAGWFCLVFGVLTLIASSRYMIPVLQAMIGPKTGASGTTIGMGFSMGLPFLVGGGALLLAGWLLILRRKSILYSAVFVFFSLVTVAGFSQLAWYAGKLPYSSPLTRAVDKYWVYSSDELVSELKIQVKKYESFPLPKFFMIDNYPTKVHALIDVLLEKYPDIARAALEKINEASNDQEIKELTKNSLLWIKPSDYPTPSGGEGLDSKQKEV